MAVWEPCTNYETLGKCFYGDIHYWLDLLGRVTRRPHEQGGVVEEAAMTRGGNGRRRVGGDGGGNDAQSQCNQGAALSLDCPLLLESFSCLQ